MSYFTRSFDKDSTFTTEEVVVQKIAIGDIQPDPDQVREHFDEEKLKELADSIRERGVLNPIHVRRGNREDEYIIITGERRYRASQIAGQMVIPCIVHTETLSEAEIKALQLIENLQRQDLSAIETAKGFESLSKSGMGQREIARHLGISEATVSKGKTILKKLPAEWIESIESRGKSVAINELYTIAKEKNQNKRKALYQKLMESAGETVEVEEEPAKKKEEKVKTEFSEEQLLKVWENLIKEKRKDIKNLALYISPKKLRILFEMREGE